MGETAVPPIGSKWILSRDDFPSLLKALSQSGHSLIGPTIRDGAIVYDEISSDRDLPSGWIDEQERGTYRLKKTENGALFAHVVGPHSWKKYLNPPRVKLWGAKKSGKSFVPDPPENFSTRYALVGVRACELHGIGIQDKVFLQGSYVDPFYKSRRGKAFILAVNCTRAGGTCFCTSMGTGPKVAPGFDLALTELLEGNRHYFVVEVGSEAGGEVLRSVPVGPVSDRETKSAEEAVRRAESQMGRQMDTVGIKEALLSNFDHPRWEDAGSRCLNCANCTMVCPTCFCSSVEDVTDLTGDHAERWRRWDSCFTMDFSYIHGGSVRPSAKARYRQWLTHKLASWIDQFGSSGCVGCGRCITWCPVGIDITEEVKAIRSKEPDEEA